jgi:pimeloyl-ACP methyl ester carboxylesterase
MESVGVVDQARLEIVPTFVPTLGGIQHQSVPNDVRRNRESRPDSIAPSRSVRVAEYDPPNARYSRVIVDELLPRLYAEYRIARDPERHAIAGWSSGAIAAFTVAWERPDHFHKVLSGIGTYVNLAGGHVYPEKVMASERKPIRIFMIDGRNDNRGVNADRQYDQTRDWFYQNVRLKDALVAKGYDVNYAWGIGVHSHDMGGAMLPEMMRWLWRDHPISVDPNDAVERSFRTGKPAEPSAAPPLGAIEENAPHATNDYNNPGALGGGSGHRCTSRGHGHGRPARRQRRRSARQVLRRGVRLEGDRPRRQSRH